MDVKFPDYDRAVAADAEWRDALTLALAEALGVDAERSDVWSDAGALAAVRSLGSALAEAKAGIGVLRRILAVEGGDVDQAPAGWLPGATSWRRGEVEVTRGHGIVGAGWAVVRHDRKRRKTDGILYRTALEAMEAADKENA